MELSRLYRYLKEAPRDGRWMMRRVGPDYLEQIEALGSSGRPVSADMGEVAGVRRVLYRADDQAELFTPVQLDGKKKRPRRRRLTRSL